MGRILSLALIALIALLCGCSADDEPTASPGVNSAPTLETEPPVSRAPSASGVIEGADGGGACEPTPSPASPQRDREALGRAFIDAWVDSDEAAMRALGSCPEPIGYALRTEVDATNIKCEALEDDRYQCDFRSPGGIYYVLIEEAGASGYRVWWAAQGDD